MPSMPISSMRPMKGEMKRRAGLGGEQRLVGREAQRDVDQAVHLDADRLAGLEAVERQRHLDADIVGDLGQDLGFLHHARYSVAATSAETGPSTMSQISLVTSAMLPPDFRISDGLVVTPSSRAEIVEFADFLHIGGIDEEFHGRLLRRFDAAAAMPLGWPLL